MAGEYACERANVKEICREHAKTRAKVLRTLVAGFKLDCGAGRLALAGLETPIGLVDDVEAAASAHHLVVPVPPAQ